MASSRPALPEPLDADALAQCRAPSASPTPLAQVGYRVAQPPVMLGAPFTPSLAGQAPQLRIPSQASVLSIPATSPASQVFQLSPRQRLPPSIPVSPRRSVNFADWKTVADITPNATTYGEHPAIFNFDKKGDHIHYFDQFGAQVKAPWKDMSLLSPVDFQSPSRTFASTPIAAASPAPAGSTPYTTAPSRLFHAAEGPLFFPSTAAPPAPAGSTPYATAPSRLFHAAEGPLFLPSTTVPASPGPGGPLFFPSTAVPASPGPGGPLFFPSTAAPVLPGPGLVLGASPQAWAPRPAQVLSMPGGSAPQSSFGITNQLNSPIPALASQPPTLGRSRSDGYLAAPTICSPVLTWPPR